MFEEEEEEEDFKQYFITYCRIPAKFVFQFQKESCLHAFMNLYKMI